MGRWIHFEPDFKEQWGFVPGQFSGIRIFFEQRDEKIDRANPPSMHAIAYFDNLYLEN